ncbi:hypothetical protein C5S32_06565 [ANME-1 cluster archaeon GoMg1]|nr:hypothetical protein [ANME-1 cluster archaeon GoMg1]
MPPEFHCGCGVTGALAILNKIDVKITSFYIIK